MKQTGLPTSVVVVFAFCMAAAAAQAQTYTALGSFGNDARSGQLVQGPNGDFYGVTECNPSGRCGMVFQVTPEGAFSTLYNFCSQANCADGSDPQGSLLVVNGNLC